jgi:hypothetical protein
MKTVIKEFDPALSHRIKFTFLFFLLPAFCFSQDSMTANISNRIKLHGYIKDMQTQTFIDNSESLITGNFIHNRINFKWDISQNVYLRAEARTRFYYGEQVKKTFEFGKQIDSDNGLIDLSYNVIDDTSMVLNTLLDRFLINWSNSNWDITLGRQRINWGINLVWNPNDIFNAFNYFDFDYEERPGTDALRIQFSISNISSIEAAYKLSDKPKEQVAAILYKTNIRKYDWQNIVGVYHTDILLGTGWAGNIKNTGFKGELSYFQPYEKTDTSGTLAASVSLDRSFENDYFVMVSYLFNSKGKTLQSGINELAGAELSAKRLMPFEHSFFAQLNKIFNPISSGTIAFIFSPTKNTLIIMPSLAFSISEDWDLSLIGQSFFSDVNKVYRTLGNGIYLRLRWSL